MIIRAQRLEPTSRTRIGKAVVEKDEVCWGQKLWMRQNCSWRYQRKQKEARRDTLTSTLGCQRAREPGKCSSLKHGVSGTVKNGSEN